ncbi:MAG: YggS family pyridoxal phosphate-dependent enzyme [Gemmatimonadota bacterium]
MNLYDARLRHNLPEVRQRLRAALDRVRRTDEVRIVAVTKGHPVDAVRAALAAGLRDCGENRVAELAAKEETLGRHAAHWHLIGHLQRNKVKQAIELFDLIHSVDSLRLAKELSAEACRAGLKVRGLIQVNASGEQTKGGINVSDDLAPALAAVSEIVQLPNLEIQGFMTMAPLVADESVLRTTFARTRRLRDSATEAVTGFTGRELSMGMTNDFEIAVEEGSTIVRLGTILFGERAK